MNKFEIPDFISHIIENIEAHGFEAYLVGGCVRDMMRSCPPSDWDIASSAPPHEIMRIFEKTVPTGIKYGTVTVFCCGGKAEVTVFRSESGYDDFRRPSQVSFGGSIKTDLSRRDFTVNAMAYSISRGLIDPFCGSADLKKHIIRAVGNPEARFEEDALRILRAFRFAASLGFEIEPKTLAAAKNKAFLVSKISGERIKAELDKLLMSKNPQKILPLLKTGALAFVGLNPENSKETYDRLARVPALKAARWAALFYLIHVKNPNLVMQKLHFNRNTQNSAARFFAELDRPLASGTAQIKKRLRAGFSPAQYGVFLKLYSAVKGCDTSEILTELEKIVENNEPYCLKMLAINGGDLLRLGASSGPICGDVLNSLLDKVIENPSLNDRKILLSLAKQAFQVH
jgi:tRNA nucleotidyltransferase (CCA-adding enzyme)